MQTELYPQAAPACNQTQATDGRTEVVLAQRRAEKVAKARAPHLATSPEKASAIATILRANGSTTTDGQNARVLRVLREVGPCTVMELQQLGDVMRPPARVLQLRQAGFEITSRWVRQVSLLGHPHRTVLYALTRDRHGDGFDSQGSGS